MISVVQRVKSCTVRVDGNEVGSIGAGLLALVAVMQGDDHGDLEYTARRLQTLRIMEDDRGRMNRSIGDVGGELMLVSQFTLAGDTRKGRRPSFSRAAHPDEARRWFDALVEEVRRSGTPVATGVFAAKMEVELVNDGPVTLILDSSETRRGGRRRPGSGGGDG